MYGSWQVKITVFGSAVKGAVGTTKLFEYTAVLVTLKFEMKPWKQDALPPSAAPVTFVPPILGVFPSYVVKTKLLASRIPFI